MFRYSRPLRAAQSGLVGLTVPKSLVLGLSVCLALSVGGATMLVGCNAGGNSQEMVFKVNDSTVTKGQLDKKSAQLMSLMNFMMPEGDNKNQQLTDLFNQMAAESLMFDAFVQQAATKHDLKISEKEVDEAFKAHSQKFDSLDTFKNYLNQMKLTEAEFKEQLKTELLKEKLIAQIAGDSVEVGEKQALQYYQGHIKEFKIPEQVRARHILKRLDVAKLEEDYKQKNPKASEDDLKQYIQGRAAKKEQEAVAVLEKIKETPQQFDQLAKSESEDPISAKQGGDLGYFSKEQMVPTFSTAAFTTAPGKLYPNVVKSRFGYHVIEVLDKKPARTLPFSEVKPQIQDKLAHETKVNLFRDWFAKQKAEASIEYGDKYQDILKPPGVAGLQEASPEKTTKAETPAKP
ncbi:MAG: peptidylprolyl isomerase [Cyanobacteria bacterium HKST-UBA06]|nr:peptidylprolyl isomerase [Cyanobacteria bacterium HKST-UBA06]